MTDNRIEKIRAEIERRYNEYMAKDSELAAIRADECLGILSFIDSMQEEPVSEDLKKEIEIYMGTNLEWDSDALRDPIESWGIKIARHFAAWQKEQDKQWLAEEHKHIFAKGRDSMKQQIMKNVKDGVITFDYYEDNDKIYGCIAHDSFCLEELGLKDGDKVKLIIIKED